MFDIVIDNFKNHIDENLKYIKYVENKKKKNKKNKKNDCINTILSKKTR